MGWREDCSAACTMLGRVPAPRLNTRPVRNQVLFGNGAWSMHAGIKRCQQYNKGTTTLGALLSASAGP